LGAYCSPNRNDANDENNDAFYNGHAVFDFANIAPIGWHVPSDKEWTELEMCLGGSNIAGGKLKEVGTVHWVGPNTGADNSSGFNALPIGCRSGNDKCFYLRQGMAAYFWTASNEICETLYRVLGSQFSDVNRFVDNVNYGMSVRCIKDE